MDVRRDEDAKQAIERVRELALDPATSPSRIASAVRGAIEHGSSIDEIAATADLSAHWIYAMLKIEPEPPSRDRFGTEIHWRIDV